MASTEPSLPDPAGARTDRPAADQVSGRTWLATAILLVAVFMELMDVTMANVAVPSIQDDIGASESQIQWVVAGYALMFAVALMTGGRLGDIFGRRRMFLTGLVGFMVTSLLCGIAPNPEFLVVSRILQGLAGSIMLPQVLACLNVWFTGKQRAAAFGLFGAVSGIGGLSAPLIGGALINGDLFGLDWRPIFLINLPIGLLTLVATIMLVDESRSPRPLRLDPLGVLVGGLVVFLVVFPVIQGREHDWPVWTWVMLALAVPAGAVFVATQRWKTRRDGSSLVDLNLFGRRGFSAGLLVTLVFFAGVTSIVFLLMVYLQSGLGYEPLRAGLTLVPLAAGVMFGSGLSINLSKRIGPTVLTLGALVGVGGVLWLSAVVDQQGAGLGVWDAVPPLAVLGLGIGIVAAPLADIVLAGVPGESSGAAAGVQSTMIQVGNAVGVAALGAIFFDLVTGGTEFPESLQRTLYYAAGVFLATALLAFLIPRRQKPVDPALLVAAQPAAEPAPVAATER
jgi:EmrB/QacA subfamily drug resistance transporter